MTKKKETVQNALVVQTNASVPDLALVASKLKGLSIETKNTYKYSMHSFNNYCKKNKVNPDLDSLLSWLDSIKNPGTQATHLAAVKKVFGEVFKNDPRFLELKTELNNIKTVKRDFTVTESGYLKKEEIDKLIKIAPQKIGIIIEFLFWTGLRVTEMLNCEHNRCLLIENGKKSYYEIRIVGKRRKEAIVYINTKMYDKINKIFNGKKYLFEHDGKQFSREYITREIAKAGLLINRDISAHKLRHSFACYLRDVKKLPIDKIQKALHHASMTVTAQYYLHGAPDAKEIGII